MFRVEHAMHFTKMHGLGNDFMIIDVTREHVDDPTALALRLSDRRCGVGFDQLALVGKAEDADAALEFFNADGSPSAACGNATRCIARTLMDATGRPSVTLRTAQGLHACRDVGSGLTAVNMGKPVFSWRDIPLAQEVDAKNLPIAGNPMALGMGNPHCVFFVRDIADINLSEIGPGIEHHPLFPERCNVEWVEILSRTSLRMRIWERGAGVTRASGSGSCASAVAAVSRDLTERQVSVVTDGGDLQIDWTDDGVWMTGPTVRVYEGELDPASMDARHG